MGCAGVLAEVSMRNCLEAGSGEAGGVLLFSMFEESALRFVPAADSAAGLP